MSDPLQTILDGFSASAMHWQSLLGVLLILFASQLLMAHALKKIFGSGFTAEEYYSLSIAGWLLPASLISLLWFVLGRIFSAQISIPITVLLVAGLTLSSGSLKTFFRLFTPVVLSLLLSGVFLIVLRMAFAARAILPLYFDSAQHYQFIKDVFASLERTDAAWPLINYYHLGFHVLAAFVSVATHAHIDETMLVLGQVILAVMPFSAFFIIRYWTRSLLAGIFALALAAVGWYMPAHAVDWGKYPALASLALIPFVLSVAYLSIQHRRQLTTQRSLGLNTILLLGMAVAIFLHSRALVIFVIAALTWVIATTWARMQGRVQFLVLCIMILALIAEILFIRTHGILLPLLDAYGSRGLLITLVVLFLSVFAYRFNPGFMFACIVSIILLLFSLSIPVGNLIPGYANMTLLDRPFVQMVIYLPLTLLGGLGLAGLEQKLQDKKTTWRTRRVKVSNIVAVFFLGVVVVNALFKYDPYPADCCDLASQDDLIAIQWMDKNLPRDARILISSTQMRVLITDGQQGTAGGDAGIWISPLIDRVTVLMPFTTDFSQQQTLDTICQMQVDYVYVGKTGTVFDESGMPVLPNAYRILLALPKTRLYEVTGCDGKTYHNPGNNALRSEGYSLKFW